MRITAEDLEPLNLNTLNQVANSASSEKVLVVSVHTNSPEFIELQSSLLARNLLVPFDFVVAIDDVQDDENLSLGRRNLDSTFREVVEKLRIPILRIPSWVHKERRILFPSTDELVAGWVTNLRASDGLQYVFSVVPWQKYKAILVLDADMFPIAPIVEIPVSPAAPIFGVMQTRSSKKKTIEYFWNGIFWVSSSLQFSHLLNFDCISERSLKADTGGQTFALIRALRQAGMDVREMKHLASGCWGPASEEWLALSAPLRGWLDSDYRRRDDGAYHAEIYDEKYLHYRGGSNWSLSEPQRELENRLNLASALGVTS